MKPWGLRLSIIVLACLGILGAGSISRAHWLGEPCPVIVVIPACYIVLFGYSMIVLSMTPGLKRSTAVFLVGWIPVVALASIGVVGELSNWVECPRTDSGIPKCYFSFTLALIIGILSWLLNTSKGKGDEPDATRDDSAPT